MKRFVLNGEKYNTGELKQDIESDVQHILDVEYGGSVTFEYNLINENEIKLIFHRNINYGVCGDFMTSLDSMMLTGIDRSAFEVDYLGNDPLVHCFPFNNSSGQSHWYNMPEEIERLYKQELTYLVNQKTKKVKISANENQMEVTVVFR
ncbi:hypothetical protein [Odoribacter laneus]|uniref:hypothetical protein n=1 Tax=Odoribacter laneus TaxID=626933 RepID=UPI003AF92E37